MKVSSMPLLHKIAVPAGAALAAILATASPVAAAETPTGSAVSVLRGAHVQFDAPSTAKSMMIDLLSLDGATTLDVEWFDNHCDAPEGGPRTCVTTYRDAYGVVPAWSSLSLSVTAVTTNVTFEEVVRTRVYSLNEDGQLTETQTDQRTTGTTRLILTGIGSGEIERREYTDARGRRHIDSTRTALVSGVAFGEYFPAEQASVTQLGHYITIS